MALQRCVWACLAANGPADNPLYHQCVERICTEGGPAQVPLPNARSPRERWFEWVLRDGTAYAGSDAMGGRLSLYYLCNTTGRSELRLVGAGLVPGTWALSADALTITLPFTADGTDLVAPIPGDDPYIEALKRGATAVVVWTDNPDDPAIIRLRGSSDAISAAQARCR